MPHILVRRGVAADMPVDLLEAEFFFQTDTHELWMGSTTGNIQITTGTLGDMLTSVYDSNNDGVLNVGAIPSSFATTTAVTAAITSAINGLVNAAPGALDTLKELADALGDDANFAATMTTALALKAPLASPALTGTPTVPTAAPGTNTTQVASTAFVTAAVAAGGGGMAIGGAVTGGTAGRVLFEGAGPVLADLSDFKVTAGSGGTHNTVSVPGGAGPSDVYTKPSLNFTGAPNDGFGSDGGGLIIFQSGVQVAVITTSAGGYRIPSNLAFCWASETTNQSYPDTSLARSAAGVVRVGDGTTGLGSPVGFGSLEIGSSFKSYNAYTDASNYERGFARWSANVFTIGTEAAGTGTARPVRLVTTGGYSVLLQQNGGSGNAFEFTTDASGGFYFTATSASGALVFSVGSSSFGVQIDAPSGVLTRSGTVYGSYRGYNSMHSNGSYDLSTNANCVAIMTPAAAPADSSLLNSRVTFYLDESGNKIKIRVRYSDGTLKTGEVALT